MAEVALNCLAALGRMSNVDVCGEEMQVQDGWVYLRYKLGWMKGPQVWLKNMHHPPLLFLFLCVLRGWCLKQGKILPMDPCSPYVPSACIASLAGCAASWHKHGRQLGHGCLLTGMFVVLCSWLS